MRFGDRHNLADQLLRADVIHKQLRLLRRTVLVQLIGSPNGGNDDPTAVERSGKPLHGIAAERAPEPVQVAGLGIIPAETAAGVTAFAVTAKVDASISARHRSVHDRHASGAIKLPNPMRVAPRTVDARGGLSGRPALAQVP